MKKILNVLALFAMCLTIFAGCQEEMVSTEQYDDSAVVLQAYGPQPVMRGGELRFLGSNLDKVVEVLIPGVDPITDINVVSAGVPSEIRVIVPKDGPEPGLVTLKTSDGNELVTKTALTYEEPILIESFSPASAAAGDVLTLKGDYFNLIHEVIFSDDVKVSEKDFVKHTRYEIQVRVPVEARTGVVGIGDVDELNNTDPSVFANVIYTEDELAVAQPEVTKMEAPRYKAGETLKITGKNFQYVDALNLPGASAVEFTVNAANTEMTFVLPDAAQDGEAVLVAKSGVEVVAGKYETVVPTELSAAPQPVKAGADLTVAGKDLDLVTGIELSGSVWAEYTVQEDGNITFPMPDTATEGDAVLHMANGKSVTVAYTLVKPVVTTLPESVSAGSDMSMSGSDLDLVKSVTFGGGLTVEVAAVDGVITVAVPTTAETGALKLNLANGTFVETESVSIDKPVACYITELPGADVEVRGGSVLTVPVANEDKLTGVQVNGKDVDYILNKTALYISLPQMAGKGTTITLISSNGTVEYVIDCIPDTVVETAVMTEMRDLGSWAGEDAGGAFRLYKADLAAAGFAPGSILKFYVAQTAFAQLQINDANWGSITMPEYNAGEAPSVIEVEVTQDFYDKVMNTSDGWSDTGMVVQGAGLIVNKVTVYYEISLEVTLWEGEVISADWDGKGLLSDAGVELSQAGAKVGSVVNFYIEPLVDDWQLKIVEGHWGPTYLAVCASAENTGNGEFTPYDLAGNGGKVSLTLTQEILDTALTQQWWGNTFLFQANNVKCTKITLL